MVVWFLAIGACGIHGIAGHPEILKALSPTYAARASCSATSRSRSSPWPPSCWPSPAPRRSTPTWATSAGRRSRGPGCCSSSPPASSATWDRARSSSATRAAAISSPFFLLVPSWVRAADGLPRHGGDRDRVAGRDHRRVLASPSRPPSSATSRGCASRTPRRRIGQIYVPWINWALLVAVLTLVFAFKTSTALAYAYGMAVTGTITITTLLFFYLVRRHWRKPLWLVVAGAAACFCVDLLFLAANLTKITHGAWLPLADRVVDLHRAHDVAARPRARHRRPRTTTRARSARSSTSSHAWSRRSTGCPEPPSSSTAARRPTPLAMRANVEHNHMLHEHVVILSIETRPVPHVPDSRADRDRRPRLSRRRDHPRHGALRLHGRARRPEPAPADPRVRRSSARSTRRTSPTSSRRSTSTAATRRA